jgi:hypothetical protein
MASVVEEVAAILHPFASADEEGLQDRVDEERRVEAEQLELSWIHGGEDPVLASLSAARARMVAAELEMRRLIAYAREFVRPRPYTLADLAEAAGMSISGIRTAYDDDEIDFVTSALGQGRRG